MQRAKSEYAIQTVSNALRVLEAFEKDEILGVTELAKRLHLHKNNVFRILATRSRRRAGVEQCADTERYRLGAVCVRLGHAFGRARSLTRGTAASRSKCSRGRPRRRPTSPCCAASRS
jgi:DNA-binding IclR family transcriptional regulator